MDYDRLCLKCMKEGVQDGVCTYCGTPAGFQQEPPFALPAGTILHGQYMAGAVLGCGGFGITYAAVDLRDGHRVAIKEYFPNGLGTRGIGETGVVSLVDMENFRYGLEQFLCEARIIYNCRGTPNIIQVEKLFEENNTAYYAMEYLEGQDLKHYLSEREGKLSFQETSSLLEPVFDVLASVHEKNIIHRDISPDNIYLCSDGTVKLLDFGAARAALQEKSKSLDVILKRGYAPVEQYYSHGRQGPWTDVYALGCTIYRCITGIVPPESPQRLKLDECTPADELCDDIPQQACQALKKAMEVSFETRFQSAAQFKAALYGGCGEVVSEQKQTYSRLHSSGQPVSPRKVTVITSSQVNEEDKGTLLAKRFGAYLIDGLIIGCVTTIVAGIIEINTLQKLYTLVFSAYFLYGFAFEASSARGTVGKKAMKLQVSSASGEKLSAGGVAVRNLFKYAAVLAGAGIPVYLAAGIELADILCALFSRKGEALHDIISGSRVAGPVSFHASHRAAEVDMGSEELHGSPALNCLSGHFTGQIFPLEGGSLVMGRNAARCNIVFPPDAAGISSAHCEVIYDSSTKSVIVKDLGSTYGTFAVDGRKLESQQMAMLHAGDSFTIGDQNTFLVVIR